MPVTCGFDQYYFVYGIKYMIFLILCFTGLIAIKVTLLIQNVPRIICLLISLLYDAFYRQSNVIYQFYGQIISSVCITSLHMDSLPLFPIVINPWKFP